ncbi:MAG: tetratricopeptide repeat protein [Sulfurovaceae bacterium]
MQNILPKYDDPLFSILLIVFLGFIIAVVAYAWEAYIKQKEHNSLLSFLEKFESSECNINTKNLVYKEHMLTPLSTLAKAFEHNGEYQKAIEIYLYLIKNIKEELPQLELMEYLGNTYLHAGFLERAKTIYLDILSKKPRSPSILYSLGLIYEMMHDFAKAKETLLPLKTMEEDTAELEAFFELEALVGDKKISKEDKSDKLVKLYKLYPSFYRPIIEQLFRNDHAKAWSIFDENRIEDILDILWFLDSSKLDMDIINAYKPIMVLYYVKGFIDTLPQLSGIFSLDMLAIAKSHGYKNGVLYFSYMCNNCKHIFPVSFKRCPNCKAINSVKVEEQIAKATTQNDNSLL